MSTSSKAGDSSDPSLSVERALHLMMHARSLLVEIEQMINSIEPAELTGLNLFNTAPQQTSMSAEEREAFTEIEGFMFISATNPRDLNGRRGQN